ncbi:MAG TPA: nitroreductase family protein [Candidatus Xenobia bacterium]|jgi:nitroreductase
MDLNTVDGLLTTTRSVRKRLDLSRPVPPELIEKCIEIALQAPSGSNRQGWTFMVVTDIPRKQGLAELYRKAFSEYAQKYQGDQPPEVTRLVDSATWLADRMEQVPAMVIPCIEGRVEHGTQEQQAALYGSILPAAWSFMLAARARGLGAAWTTLHLVYEKEAANLLNIPSKVTQACLLPVAFYTGTDFKPAARKPARELTYWNSWGNPRG